MPPKLQRVRAQQSLTEQAHSALRNAIASGQMRPGEMHSVAELALQLGVSRTPVREAVLQLARIGMVEVRRNQGVVVLARTEEDVARIYQLRLWLEVPAVEIAASTASPAQKEQIRKAYSQMLSAAEIGDQSRLEHADTQFHSLILNVTDNPRLVSVVRELRDLLMSRNQTTTGKSQSLLEVAHDHDDILAAIENGDGPAAAACMRVHLETTCDRVITLFRD
ncbi:GntR family transcriptional regulator [Luethyella okanaganae]|uniref:GntR family transcriptional regulator n=1 Tax=Luethyella okanaganae TaxID=69372 RepID=A0ABW1VIE5_9MICO